MSLETERRHAQDLADMLAPLGEVGVTRFFSGAGLTLAGRQFAFVIDGTLYLRTDAEGRAAFEALGAGPFSYDGPSRQVIVRAYYQAPDEIMDDPEMLCDWAARAFQAATRAAAAQPPRRARPKRRSTRPRDAG